MRLVERHRAAHVFPRAATYEEAAKFLLLKPPLGRIIVQQHRKGKKPFQPKWQGATCKTREERDQRISDFRTWLAQQEVTITVSTGAFEKRIAAIFEKAQQAPAQPLIREVIGKKPERNRYVRQSVLFRANGECEVPGCTVPPIVREDGTVHLHTHHLWELQEKREYSDTVEKVIACCLQHHGELHYGKDRFALTEELLPLIAVKTREFRERLGLADPQAEPVGA